MERYEVVHRIRRRVCKFDAAPGSTVTAKQLEAVGLDVGVLLRTSAIVPARRKPPKQKADE